MTEQAQAEDRRAVIGDLLYAADELDNIKALLSDRSEVGTYAKVEAVLAELSRLSRVEQALQPFMRRWMDNPEASTYLWTLVQEYEPELPFSGRRQEMLDAVTALETALSASPEAQPE